MIRPWMLFVLVGVACQQAAPPEQAIAPFHFRFVREGCFGDCPSYELVVLSTGDATIREMSQSAPAVESRGRIEPERIRSLISQHQPFTQPPSNFPPDAGSVVIELRDQYGYRRVRDAAVESWTGGGVTRPATPLQPFAAAMDQIVKETKWQRIGA